MNLKDGGKQPILRDTVFNGQRQSLILPDGRPKGIQTILTERGLWKSNLRLFCGVKKTIVTNDDCCARHILAAQEDFKVNKPLLQEVIESMGHKVIFYPKFHPELNFIEQYDLWIVIGRDWRDDRQNLPLKNIRVIEQFLKRF